jgi:DUF971 family protein
MTKAPISIIRPKPFILKAEWEDGFSAIISCEQFRRECPCAECTGERINDVIYSRPKPIKFEPGVFDLLDLKIVGNYAIAAFWGNKHNTGIYTWDKFRQIFEKFALSDEEIEKIEKKATNDKRNIVLNVVK